MAVRDISRLLEQAPRVEEGGPFSAYIFVLVVPLFTLALLLASLRSLLIALAGPPAAASVVLSLALSLVLGVLLAILLLMAVVALWLRNRWGGLILSTALFLVWLGWTVILSRPGGAAASALAVLLGLGIPVIAALWFLRPLGILLPALSSVLWLGLWFLMTFFLRQYGLGVLLLACAVGASAVLLTGLYLTSGSLLPVVEQGGQRGTVFRCLSDQAGGWNYPYYVVTDEPHEEDKVVKRGGDAFSYMASAPGLILSDCDHAVAVSDGIRFKGVQGPGVIFTTFGDRPLRSLDLRPQLRVATVQGLTRDGIEVRVPFFAPFQIDRGGQEPTLGQPFPYRRSAAFKAVLAQTTEHPGTSAEPTQRAWDELPVIIGTHILRDLLSHYRFDELYGPYNTDQEPPRRQLAQEFLRRLDRELQPLGIRRVGGGIGNLLPAKEEVLLQRIRSWQAEWTRRVMMQRARSRTEWLWRIEQARAEAQAELILALGERLAQLDQADSPVSPDKVVTQFLRLLEDLALRPGLQRYLPRGLAQDVHHLGGSSDE